ncbi:hypothetical protein Clacol_007107 [Clathrus columnatus]|uniref:BED-type domain-containing protein n=1 Tax=Clathrus columnatus TaxID=1419009 RepID=A0AAV5AK80_9AGAM|nr:hypothetical protein Clacol_007107 [Clathrus columnatus]
MPPRAHAGLESILQQPKRSTHSGSIPTDESESTLNEPPICVSRSFQSYATTWTQWWTRIPGAIRMMRVIVNVMGSRFNPQNMLQTNHTGFGMPTHDIPQNFVTQQSQGSGSLTASGTNQFVSGTASGSNSFDQNTPHTHPAPSSNVTNPTPYWLPNGPPFPPYITTTLPQPQPLLRTRTPSKKRTHKAAKTPLTSTATPGPKNGRLRKALKSKAWIDTYFKNRKICKLCGGGCTEGRIDRLLEHLVSVHFVQVIKNRNEYDAGHFVEQADLQPHFIATQTAFDYTRRFIDVVRCSLCSDDTSLVFRTPSIWNHLKKSHAKTTNAIRQGEADRLGALEPDKEEFYNLHDKFLYHFPGGINSEIGGWQSFYIHND